MHYKLNESMYQDNTNIAAVNSNLKDAKVKVDSLIDFLKSSEQWKGAGKESIGALLELCSKLHGDVLDISVKNEEALKSIISKTDEFTSDDDIVNIWRKEC